METKAKLHTEIRNSEIDIIKGASNTDQLEALRANATQSQNTSTVKTANILAVNNGGMDIESEDLQNPAIRGI